MKRVLIVSLVIAAVFTLHAIYLAVVAEDAFISFRYASHLASGHGLTWNIGAPPVEGYTNFLWVLLAAAAIALGFSVTLFSQVAGVAAGLATLVYVYRFGRSRFHLSPLHSSIACLLLALSGPFATWATSGMETSLFTLFVVAACYHWTGWLTRRSTNGGCLAAGFLVLATLTRPEGVLIAATLFASGWLLMEETTKRYVLSSMGPALVYLLPVAAYMVWRVSYFGDWLPNTYYAKVAGSPYRIVRGLIYTAAFLVYFVLSWAPLLLVAWHRERAGGGMHRSSRWALRRAAREHPVHTSALAVCFVFAVYVVFVGGDYMAMYRFFVPVLPLVYLLVSSFASPVLRSRHAGGRPIVGAALAVLGIAFTLVHSTPLDRRLFPKPPRQHGHYGGVQTERWHSARLSLIGKFFHDYRRSARESLATDAIGAISYYSELTVYGFHGLVDRHIARRRAKGQTPGLGLPGHEKGNLMYILSLRPTFIVFSRLLEESPAGYPELDDETAAELLEREYEPVSVWLEDNANGEAGYFTFYQRRASPNELR
jgi:arabinofuranosyltransferase